jgi:hypothetical protein
MYLRDHMETVEQLAFMVTLCHDEWLEQEQAGMAEYNFDEWLPFIGQLALQIASVKPRDS